MSVIVVLLGFVFICLILVHLNLHKKKNEFYNYINSLSKTLMTRHKKIDKLLKLVADDELTEAIKHLNKKIIDDIEKGDLSYSKRIKIEVLIEDKMKQLLKILESTEQPANIQEAIDSYKVTQHKLDKHIKKYNKMMSEFLSACNIKPADLFISFEHIDTDFEEIKEN